MALVFGAAGTPLTSLNASVSPLNPAGFSAGALLCVAVGARGDGTFACSGWNQAFQIAHASSGINKLALFWKLAVGGDTKPTITYTDGGATDDVIGQTCYFTGQGSVPIAEVGTTFSGINTTNIGPIDGITIANGNAALALALRADDWTSVATLSTGNSLTWDEIGEPDVTVGGDAGLVWNYTINSTGSPAATGDKTFAVTGGAQQAVGVIIELQALIIQSQAPRTMHQMMMRRQ